MYIVNLSANRDIRMNCSLKETPRHCAGAVDRGTTSTRFMIFDHAGAEVAQHQLERTQIMPRPGWVEHDPAEIRAHTQAVIEITLPRSAPRQCRNRTA